MAHAAFNGEYKYHVKLKQGDVGRYVLLPGDPGRCEVIARSFDNPVKVAQNESTLRTRERSWARKCP